MNLRHRPVRVLLVEDSEDDAYLVERELAHLEAPVEVKRVDRAQTLREALREGPWDIVVSDFRLPTFSGMAALAMVRQFDRNLPFILVSGRVGEEAAVEAMRAGASDYVMKGSLARLSPAVARELRHAAMRLEPEGPATPGSARALQVQLRQALARDEFDLHYQPQYGLDDMTIRGLEALLRWRSPEHGTVMPARFVPLLEETGLILEVGQWVLRRAAADQRRWRAQGLAAPRIAVNVSMVQVASPDFVQSVKEAVFDGDAVAGIDLEITETVLMNDVRDSVEKLNALRDIGLRVIIDDFGVGYSSLAYLAQLPAQALKIDRSFVDAMLREPHAVTLVSAVINMSRHMGLDVVAEGIEQRSQLDALKAMGCHSGQGYFLGRPASFGDTTATLRNGLRQIPLRLAG